MRVARHEPAPHAFSERLYETAHRYRAQLVASINVQRAKSGSAKLVGLFQYRVEHRGEVAGRGVDDLQDLGGSGLLGESLITLARRLIQVPLRLVTLGQRPVAFCGTFGKLALEIGYEPLGIG
jgi:hypothetical protein